MSETKPITPEDLARLDARHKVHQLDPNASILNAYTELWNAYPAIRSRIAELEAENRSLKGFKMKRTVAKAPVLEEPDIPWWLRGLPK